MTRQGVRTSCVRCTTRSRIAMICRPCTAKHTQVRGAHLLDLLENVFVKRLEALAFHLGLLVPLVERGLQKGPEPVAVGRVRRGADFMPVVPRRELVPVTVAVIILPPLDAGRNDLLRAVVLHHQTRLRTSLTAARTRGRHLDLQQTAQQLLGELAARSDGADTRCTGHEPEGGLRGVHRAVLRGQRLETAVLWQRVGHRQPALHP